jgi:alpha-tubulin suppressor-like RCC1 family protein
MSDFIEKYKISAELKKGFAINIRFLFFFADYESCRTLNTNRNDVLIVTKEDDVYAIGDNLMGRLGLGHNYVKKEPTIVSELSNKGIVDFSNGLYHVIARDKYGKIYNWGNNEFGQLGNGTRDTKCYKPELIKHLAEENFIDICCGSYHSLVLSETGCVYAWGYSDWGQTGNGCDDRYQLVPIKVRGFGNESVVQISCGFYNSLALTETGRVFKWGFKGFGQSALRDCGTVLNVFETDFCKCFFRSLPINVRVKGNDVVIEKISCGRLHNLLLSCDGDIYTFGCNRFGQLGEGNKIYRKNPKKLNHKNKFIDIASHFSCDISVALSVNQVFYVWGKCGEEIIKTPKETEFKSFHETFAFYFLLLDSEHKCKSIECETEKSVSLNGSMDSLAPNRVSCSNATLTSRQISIKFEKYEILNELSEEFVRNIKIITVFYNNVIIATKDDNILSFGNNTKGCLGLGFESPVEEPTIVEELSEKPCLSLFNGLHHVMALTNSRKLYIWGNNEFGQLGNGSRNTECNKPELNQYFIDKFITDISCGEYHTLALTNTGEVYSWGDNRRGQVGDGRDDSFQLTPIKLYGFSDRKIAAISCGARHSVALSEKGRVFSWGYNFYGQLGIGNKTNSYSPRLVKIRNNNKNIFIKKVSCGQCYTLLLACDGDIYAFGYNNWGQLGIGSISDQNIPIRLKSENKFIDIASHFRSDISAALSESGCYYVWGKCNEALTSPSKTNFKSFNQIFAHFLQIIHKPILLFDENSIIIDTLQNNKCKQEFDEFSIISFGSFGIVLKARNKNEDEICAIKKIGINNNYIDPVLNELKIMSKLKSDYVVEFKKAWIEINYMKNDINSHLKNGLNFDHRIFGRNSTLLLHIQMELCYKTLKEVIKEILEKLEIKPKQLLSPIGYYITSQLFKEILESVNYLHKQNPPIIHRDLKPTNILVTNGSNGRFVKIADFGLATVHEFDEQTHTQGLGTLKYMAPEVLNQKYDTKADIYSLGLIIPELFNFENKK